MRKVTCERLSDILSRDVDAPYRIALGEPVAIELADCFGRFPGREAAPAGLGPNPVTGPLAVDGAEPGDTIAVEIRDIDIVGDGFVGSAARAAGPEQRGPDTRPGLTVIPIDTESNVALYAQGMAIPLAPMIGTIGVAPAGEGIDTHRAGDHGGNMDCNIVRAGTIVCFAVHTPGAGLGLGDVHARMGDGEVSGQGIEAAAVVTIRVEKVRGLGLPRPYGLHGERFFIVGWGGRLEEAADRAQADAVDLLTRLTDLTQDQAQRFLGIGSDLRVGWRGGATPTVWLELALRDLPVAARDEIVRGVSAPLCEA